MFFRIFFPFFFLKCISVDDTEEIIQEKDLKQSFANPIKILPPAASLSHPQSQEETLQLQHEDEELVYSKKKSPHKPLLQEEIDQRDKHLARQTDKEIIESTQQVDFNAWQRQTEQALGFEETSIPTQQPPSYTLTMEKVYELYQEKNYPRALILVNKVLGYYPRSVEYLKMKGTLHHRMAQYPLALQAYEKAFEINPSEKLKQQILFLRRLVNYSESSRQRTSP